MGSYKLYVSEMVATFVLIFCGCGAAVVNAAHPGTIGAFGVYLAFGFSVVAMVYTLGHISHAHMNPAVSIALAFVGKFDWKHVLAYCIAQVTGSVVASVTLAGLFGGDHISAALTLPAGNLAQSFILEIVISAILMFVIMGSGIDKRAHSVNAALSIGLTVVILCIVGGQVSGASMNPARSLGPALIAANFTDQWIYLFAPVTGMLAGAYLYQTLKGDENQPVDDLLPHPRLRPLRRQMQPGQAAAAIPTQVAPVLPLAEQYQYMNAGISPLPVQTTPMPAEFPVAALPSQPMEFQQLQPGYPIPDPYAIPAPAYQTVPAPVPPQFQSMMPPIPAQPAPQPYQPVPPPMPVASIPYPPTNPYNGQY